MPTLPAGIEPVFQGMRTSLKGAFGALTGRQGQEDTSPTNTSTTKQSSGPSHATDEDAIESDEERKITSRAVQPQKKRAAHSEQSETPEARKRLKPAKSAHEKRLMGDYETPKSAVPIGVPIYEDTSSYKQTQGRSLSMGGSKVGGGVKPTNTLYQQPHEPKKPGRGDSPRTDPRPKGMRDYRDFNQDSKAITGQKAFETLPTRFSTGANVPAAVMNNPVARESGYDPVDGRSAKKQKTSHDNWGTGIAQSPIPLDEDDHPTVPSSQPSVPGGQFRRRSPAVQASKHARSLTAANPLGHNILREQDAKMYGGKKSRKPKDGSRRSQTSVSESPSIVDLAGDDDVPSPGSRNAPFSVADSQEFSHEPLKNVSQPPAIDLGKGMDDIQLKRKSAVESSEATRRASDVPPASNERAKQLHANVRRQVPQEDSGDQFFESTRQTGIGSTNQSHPAPLQKLNDTFRRDDSQRLSTQQKARHRMQESSAGWASRVSPIDDSDDALLGGNTVPSAVGSAASPRRPSATPRKGSPSDIRRTKFISSGRHAQEQAPERRQLERDETSNGHGAAADSVPVQAFYASSCVLNDGRITLRYNEEDGVEIYHNGAAAIVPGKKRTVGIGVAEARKINHCFGNSRLYIQGSSTDVSNGRICIAFSDHDRAKRGIELIHAATNDKATLNSMTSETLNSTFAKQCAELSEAYARKVQHAGRDATLTHFGLNHQGATHDDEEGSDSIKYEDDDEHPRQPSRRSQMQGGDTGRTISDRQPVRSPHFQQFGPARRSTRQPKPVTEVTRSPSPIRWTQANNPKRWAHSVTYPAEGARRTTVDFNDLENLDEGEFLNDNIVSFALRQIEERMAPEQREKVHFFNSFFYTTLSTKNGKKMLNYDAVKRWTKNKDLFSTPYIVVPICVDLHWFVLIICNLQNLSRKVAGDDEMEKTEEGFSVPDSGQVTETEDAAEPTENRESDEQTRQQTQAMHDLSLMDSGNDRAAKEDVTASAGDTASRDPQDLAVSAEQQDNATGEQAPETGRPGALTGKKGKRKRTPPQPRKFSSDAPAIITLDSFGSTHPTEIRYLKDYLVAEADAKRGMSLTRDALQGVTAKGIPSQTNFCDCGLYLIGYVEQFARNPSGFVEKVLQKQLDQQADFADFDPSAKRAEVRNELLRLNKEQEEAHKARKQQKKAASVGQASSGSNARQSPEKPQSGATTPKDKSKSAQHPTPGAAQAGPRSVDPATYPTGGANHDSTKETSKISREGVVSEHNHQGRPASPPQSSAPPNDTSSHTAMANEDEDELEESVPQALPQQHTAEPSADAWSRQAQSASQSSRTAKDEADEMLDNGDQLLNELQGSLEKRYVDKPDFTAEDKRRVPLASTEGGSQESTDDDKDDYEPPDIQHSGPQAPIAEVPDSQEATVRK